MILTEHTQDFCLQAQKLQGSEFGLQRVTLDQARRQLQHGLSEDPSSHVLPSDPVLGVSPPTVLLIGPLGAQEARAALRLRAAWRLSDRPIVMLLGEVSG